MFIYWDADEWEWVKDSEEAISGAVVDDGWRSDTYRRSHVEFLHYDTAADADREYAADFRLSTIGNVAPTNRTVFGVRSPDPGGRALLSRLQRGERVDL